MNNLRKIGIKNLKREYQRDYEFFIKEHFNQEIEGSFSEADILKLQEFVDGLNTGLPRDYLIGNSEFYDYKFFVDEGVLIPRPETELIIEVFSSLPLQTPSKVIDLGTGSGCIGQTLAKQNPDHIFFGLELSTKALNTAKKNHDLHELKNFFLIQGDWLKCCNKASLDIVIANPPYLEKNDPHLADLSYEPEIALVADDCGLSNFKKIALQANSRLKEGGYLIFEHGFDQSKQVEKILSYNKFSILKKIQDYQGWDRLIIAQK